MFAKTIPKIAVLLFAAGVCHCVYEEQEEPRQQQYYRDEIPYKRPLRILSHKQAQDHDGSFKFAYTGENGVQHTEIIAPDGSRNGGYSYVDPHGKTISVRYTAGKEGFRIIEGDHVPRESPAHAAAQEQYSRQAEPQQPKYIAPQPKYIAPQPKYIAPQPKYLAPQPKYFAPQAKPYLKPQPVQYERPAIDYPQYREPVFVKPQYRQPPYPTFANQAPQQRDAETNPSNSLDDPKEPEYNDEPGKPYSFGAGFSFQIAN